MDHTPHIGVLFITAQMHFDFTGRAQAFGAFQHFPLAVDSQQLFRGNKAFAHAGGSTEERAVLQSCGYISVVGCHPAQLPGFMADIADLFFYQVDVHFGTLLSFLLPSV